MEQVAREVGDSCMPIFEPHFKASDPLRVVFWHPADVQRLRLLTDRLTTSWEVVRLPERPSLRQAGAALGSAVAMVADTFPRAWRDIATELRLVQCPGAGIDAFDLDALPPGCVLCNVHEHEVPIAEYVMLAVLMCTTRIERHSEAFRRGIWSGSARVDGAFHDEACGKTLGLVGFGHIGQVVAHRAACFGMDVIAVSRRPRAHPDLRWCGTLDRLDDLLGESDFVVVACPLTTETRGIIAGRELRLLRPSAYLINPSRAEIIEEDSLYEALHEKWFAGAALDVWYQYPGGRDEKMHGSRLPFHELDNVLITPHFSAWSHEMLERRYQRLAENLDRLARDEPLDRVVYQAPATVKADKR